MSNLLARELHRSKYRLLGLVGQGQFGRVYCAAHRKTGRLVALKQLERDRFSTQKFLRELRFLLSLQHENIVTCHAIEQTATGRYLVMDYCESGTFRSLLEEEVQLHPLQGLRLMTQLLTGLAHAHQRQIVHCDIKPENILLTATAKGWTARISDFGIARLSQEMTSEEFSNTGSPAYMAPERFYGQYFIPSDLYAVGVMLFEMLVGYRPFSGAPGDLMSAHLNRTVEIPPHIPEPFQAVIRKSMQKLPARRYRSAEEMLAALQGAIAESADFLQRDWTADQLMRFAQLSDPVPLRHCYTEVLDTAIGQLVGQTLETKTCPPGSMCYAAGHPFAGDRIFRIYGQRVGCQPYTDESAGDRVDTAPLRHPPPDMTRVRLPHPITQLVVRPHGCFAVTERSVYWLTAELFQPLSDTPLEPNQTYVVDASTTSPQLVAGFERGRLVAIAPDGRWMVTTDPSSEQTNGQVQIWHLRNPRPFQPHQSLAIQPSFQLAVLDSRHFVVFSHLTDSGHTYITGVHLEVFSRRGSRLGHFKIPLPLRTLALTKTPYRLIATEPSYPQSLLIIDLKPFRIQRVGLPIVPEKLTCTVWGYAIIDRAGQIVLIDPHGQLIGQIAGPAQPTAITFVQPHQLAIANWQQQQGYLYGINLRDLDLDILF